MLQARPVVALPDGTIVAGNMRYRAAEALGWTTIPAIIFDLDETTARLWLLRDNNEYGEWLDDALGELLYELDQAGVDLDYTGFDRKTTTRMLDAVSNKTRGGTTGADDPAPEPPGKPRSRRGRVYEIGGHRIMCGDATNAKDVAKLLAGAEPRLCVTDPPYGVGLELGWRSDGPDGEIREGRNRRNEWKEREGTYGGGKRGSKGSPGGRPGRNASSGGHTSMPNDDRSDWSSAFELVPSLDVVYHYFADIYVADVLAGLRRVGFELSQFIIWDKMAFALSRAHYHWRHEAAAYAVRANVDTEVPWYGPAAEIALYARKPGSGVPFLGARDQATIWSAPSPKRRHDSLEDEPADHPTQKPTLLYTRPYSNHTLRGDAVYEPFAGSGTAIIAAEILDRRCYAMEIDPAFVDVCRDRWAAFTGHKA